MCMSDKRKSTAAEKTRGQSRWIHLIALSLDKIHQSLAMHLHNSLAGIDTEPTVNVKLKS